MNITLLRSVNRLTSSNVSCFCTTASQVAYKSAISIQNIYPNSNTKITTPNKPTEEKTFSGFIPINELNITYSRSSGPGGQNVNMVNTKVDLRFNVKDATWISEEIKTKLLEKYKTKVNKEGCMVFRSELTRSQQLNLADCLQKVRTAIRSICKAEPVVSEETQEKIRQRCEKAARERLMIKRQRSQIKSNRQDPTVH